MTFNYLQKLDEAFPIKLLYCSVYCLEKLALWYKYLKRSINVKKKNKSLVYQPIEFK